VTFPEDLPEPQPPSEPAPSEPTPSGPAPSDPAPVDPHAVITVHRRPHRRSRLAWVGGGIVVHGLHEIGLHAPSDLAHGVQHAIEQGAGPLGGILGWFSYAAFSALFGLVLGAVIALVLHKGLKIGAH